MRVGYMGDLYKVKKIDTYQIVEKCEESNIDLLILCGGISNNYKTSLDFIDKLGTELDRKKISLRFIIGNTDLYYEEVVVNKERKIRDILKLYNESRYYLKNQPIMKRGVRIVACNGWYDYTFYRGKARKLSDITKKRKLWYRNKDVVYLTDERDYSVGLENTFDYKYWKENRIDLINKLQGDFQKLGKAKNSVVVTYFKPSKAFMKNDPISKYRGTFEGSLEFADLLEKFEVDECYFGMSSPKVYVKIEGVNYYCCSVKSINGLMEVVEYE